MILFYYRHSTEPAFTVFVVCTEPLTQLCKIGMKEGKQYLNQTFKSGGTEVVYMKRVDCWVYLLMQFFPDLYSEGSMRLKYA